MLIQTSTQDSPSSSVLTRRRLLSGASVASATIIVSLWAKAGTTTGTAAAASGIGASPASLRPPQAALSRTAASRTDTIFVSTYYKKAHGINHQPAYQAAINAANKLGITRIVNDLPAAEAQMWCPKRYSAYGIDGSAPDGVPLVISSNLDIDFNNVHLTLKGPTGGDRMIGQPISGFNQRWLGGWLYAIDGLRFNKLIIRNVSVDGTFRGDTVTANDVNLTDKGIRVQSVSVKELYLYNVEVQNFAAEIYFVAGLGPDYQYLQDCHFAGSPQCAFNPAGIGRLDAVRLRAGRAYQTCEIIGGKGHHYIDTEFYDAGFGGASICGGPSSTLQPGYPCWYSYWDGQGEPPFVFLENTRFTNCVQINMTSWIKGHITAIDTALYPYYLSGNVHSINLLVDSICDKVPMTCAVFLGGPQDRVTQVEGAPRGVYVSPPSDINLVINIASTPAATAANYGYQCAVLMSGGLFDAETIEIDVLGTVRQATLMCGEPAPGFRPPTVNLN